ncbi:hypothetical protein ACFLS0_07035 [Candidatus Bipolaricaulota bacterium]
MTTALDELHSGVAPRDDGPLQSLLYSWAAARGRRKRLPFAQERLLESVNATLCLNRTQRTRSLDWSIKKFQDVKGRLGLIGFVKAETISRGTGRPETYLVLTDDGYRYLRSIRVKENRPHGSLEHHCSIQWLQHFYRQMGFKVSTTHKLALGLIVDLLCSKDDETIAIEVVHSDNLYRDAKKAGQLAKHVSRICFVATTKDLFSRYDSKLPALLPDSARDKVHFAVRDELIAQGGDGAEDH